MDNNYYAPPNADLEQEPAPGEKVLLPSNWGPMDVYQLAWAVIQKELGVWLAVAGVVFGTSLLQAMIGQVLTFGVSLLGANMPADQQSVFGLLGSLASLGTSLIFWPINIWLAVGQARISLAAVRGEPITLGQLFSGLPWLLSALGGAILVGLGTFVGVLLLIAPGVIFASGMLLFTLVVVDQNPGALSAIGQSWAISDGYKGRIFLSVFVAGLALFILTVCTCGLGGLLFIAAAPLFSVGLALIYESILSEKPHLRAGA